MKLLMVTGQVINLFVLTCICLCYSLQYSRGYLSPDSSFHYKLSNVGKSDDFSKMSCQMGGRMLVGVALLLYIEGRGKVALILQLGRSLTLRMLFLGIKP